MYHARSLQAMTGHFPQAELFEANFFMLDAFYFKCEPNARWAARDARMQTGHIVQCQRGQSDQYCGGGREGAHRVARRGEAAKRAGK